MVPIFVSEEIKTFNSCYVFSLPFVLIYKEYIFISDNSVCKLSVWFTMISCIVNSQLALHKFQQLITFFRLAWSGLCDTFSQRVSYKPRVIVAFKVNCIATYSYVSLTQVLAIYFLLTSQLKSVITWYKRKIVKRVATVIS